MEDLPDAILGLVMSFADYGAAKGESTCPAARFACVCKRWHRIFKCCAPLVTNELLRISSWEIKDTTHPAFRANDVDNVETIVDSWVRPVGSRVPRWWTSGVQFEGGEWTGNYEYDSLGGPFTVRRGWPAPCLEITFGKTVKIRAIAIAARNRPRKIQLMVGKTCSESTCSASDNKPVILDIPPPSRNDLPEIGQSYVPMNSPRYMDLVARELPQGKSPRKETLLLNSALPVVLPKSLVCDKEHPLKLTIIQSHERGWVGINQMSLFE